MPDLCGLYSQEVGSMFVHVDNGTPPLLIAVNSRFHNSYLIIEGLRYHTAYTEDETDYLKTAEVLLTHSANPNINSNDPTYPSPIFYALENHVLLQLLIENGAEVNIANEKGQTPLCVLVEMIDDAKAAKILVEGGAEVDPPECNPLYTAISLHHM